MRRIKTTVINFQHIIIICTAARVGENICPKTNSRSSPSWTVVWERQHIDFAMSTPRRTAAKGIAWRFVKQDVPTSGQIPRDETSVTLRECEGKWVCKSYSLSDDEMQRARNDTYIWNSGGSAEESNEPVWLLGTFTLCTALPVDKIVKSFVHFQSKI